MVPRWRRKEEDEKIRVDRGVSNSTRVLNIWTKVDDVLATTHEMAFFLKPCHRPYINGGALGATHTAPPFLGMIQR